MWKQIEYWFITVLACPNIGALTSKFNNFDFKQNFLQNLSIKVLSISNVENPPTYLNSDNKKQ